jgi:NADH:ubiquinone oxidoreductase subunit F (NADH-binding)
MTHSRRVAPNPSALPRLFGAAGPTLTDHERHFGRLPEIDGGALAALLDQAGLTGRGGAGFPTGRKIASVSGRRPVVVGNGAEGEPLSFKDAALLTGAPHLVLDGLALAADAVGAHDVYVYVPAKSAAHVRAALDDRRAAGTDRRRVTVVEAPDAFVAGEESAVMRRIEGGPALPRDRTVLAAISGVRGRPTLINNVETLAHLALVARYGPQWFRAVGDPDGPGTMLVTLSGIAKRRVLEVPTGTRLTELLGRRAAELGAVLIGGYHGTWLPASAVTSGVRLSRAGLAPLGASPGAGVVHALPASECGLARTADIVTYLAEEGARQCGPCRNGLPRLAQLLDEIAYGRIDGGLLRDTHRMVGLVDGRGSCRHPDGTARLIRSALEVFADDITSHRRGHCNALLTTTSTSPLHAARCQ